MNSIWYGDFYIDLINDVGGRVECRPSDPGSVVLVRRHTPPARPLPVPPGRQPQVDDAARAISAYRAIEFHAPCGFGKTTLLRYIAAHTCALLGRPGVYLEAGGDHHVDLLQRLVTDLYSADQPTKFPPDVCARLLTQAGAVVVLDDIACGAEELAYLMQALSGCAVILGSDRPRLGAHGRSEALPGLSDEAALVAIRSDLGRQVTLSETHSVARLVTAVGGQPLRLRQAAALVRTREQSFAGLADQVGSDPKSIDRMNLDGLADTHRRALAAVSLLGGALLPADIIAAVSNVEQVAGALEDLRDRGLVEHDGDRFGLPVCRSAGYRTQALSYLNLGSAAREIANWLIQRDPGSDATIAVAQAALSLVGIAAERHDWENVVRLVRVAEPILTLAGRWETCRHLLDLGVRAAHMAGDTAAEALFTHQHGTLALCLDQTDIARQDLSNAVELRQRIGDKTGAEVSWYNLSQLPPLLPPLPIPNVMPDLPRRRARSASRGALAITALVLGVLAIYVGIADANLPSASTLQRPSTPTRPVHTTTATATNGPDLPQPSPPPPRSPSHPPQTPSAPVAAPPQIDGNTAFGRVHLYESAEPRVFTITNPNETAITLARPTISAIATRRAFGMGPGDCGETLDPGQKCTVEVMFIPTQIGENRATLTVSDQGGHIASKSLTGTGYVWLKINIVGNGIVERSDRRSIPCPYTCTMVIWDRSVELTATPTPNGGHGFWGWDGACAAAAGASTCELLLGGDTDVKATFGFIVE